MIDSKSETRSSRRKKSSADLGFHYPGDLLSQARPRRRPLYKRNTVSDFANSRCRHTSTATLMSSIEPGTCHTEVNARLLATPLLGPVHTSNIVEATFGFVATNGNNVERFYCKISSFRLCRNKLNMYRSTCSIRPCCFDIVAGMDGALKCFIKA